MVQRSRRYGVKKWQILIVFVLLILLLVSHNFFWGKNLSREFLENVVKHEQATEVGWNMNKTSPDKAIWNTIHLSIWTFSFVTFCCQVGFWVTGDTSYGCLILTRRLVWCCCCPFSVAGGWRIRQPCPVGHCGAENVAWNETLMYLTCHLTESTNCGRVAVLEHSK